MSACIRAAFPDVHFTIEDQIAEGDKSVSRWTARGTHTGELMGIPPTDKHVTVTGMGIARYANGKIAESWLEFDALGMLPTTRGCPCTRASQLVPW